MARSIAGVEGSFPQNAKRVRPVTAMNRKRASLTACGQEGNDGQKCFRIRRNTDTAKEKTQLALSVSKDSPAIAS